MDDLLDDNLDIAILDNNEDIAAANKARTTVNESTTAIKHGRFAILALIGLVVLGVILGLVQGETEPIYIYIEGGLMISLYLIAYLITIKNRFAGLLMGLLSYLFYIGLYVYADPASIFSGILVKVIVLYTLGKGIIHTQQLKDRIEALKAIHLTQDDLTLIHKLKELPKIHYIKKK